MFVSLAVIVSLLVPGIVALILWFQRPKSWLEWGCQAWFLATVCAYSFLSGRAMDIVTLDRWEKRADGWVQTGLDQYVIFGQPV